MTDIVVSTLQSMDMDSRVVHPMACALFADVSAEHEREPERVVGSASLQTRSWW